MPDLEGFARLARASARAPPTPLAGAIRPPPAASLASPHANWTELDWHDAFEERAAIMEFDGGLPRAEAERQARIDIATLRAPKSPQRSDKPHAAP